MASAGDHSPQFGIKFRWGNRDNSPSIGATHGGDYNSSGLQFRTMDKQNIVDAMHIRPNGNVGIGVSSPDHKLTLLSSGGMGSIRLMGNPGYDNHIRYDYPSMTKDGETPTNLSQVDHWVAGCDSSTVLSDDFLIWNSNRNKIDFLIDHTTGNVGIGITGYNSSQGSSITTPETPLHVEGAFKVSAHGAANNWAYLVLEGHGTNSEGKGKLSISNYGNAGSGSMIDCEAGPIRIQMSPTGSYVEETGTVEKFRFHAHGGLSVNTTAISDKKLYVSGEAYTTVGWTGSDDRLKHNEESINNALGLIGKLNPVKYIKTNEMYEANHDFALNENNQPIDDNGEVVEHTLEAGIIAQELLQIPELKYVVSEGSTEEDGTETPHSVNYNSLLSIALKAIQELKAEVNALKNKNK